MTPTLLEMYKSLFTNHDGTQRFDYVPILTADDFGWPESWEIIYSFGPFGVRIVVRQTVTLSTVESFICPWHQIFQDAVFIRKVLANWYAEINK